MDYILQIYTGVSMSAWEQLSDGEKAGITEEYMAIPNKKEARFVLQTAGRHHVVAGAEATQCVPRPGRVRVVLRNAGEHGDHRRAGGDAARDRGAPGREVPAGGVPGEDGRGRRGEAGEAAGVAAGIAPLWRLSPSPRLPHQGGGT